MRKITGLCAISAVCLALAAGNAGAADLANGQTLHDTHCVACHTSMSGGDGSSLYTREQRMVNDLSGLQNQVQRCSLNLGLKWFETELEDVSAYLNATYYHFPETEGGK